MPSICTYHETVHCFRMCLFVCLFLQESFSHPLDCLESRAVVRCLTEPGIRCYTKTIFAPQLPSSSSSTPWPRKYWQKQFDCRLRRRRKRNESSNFCNIMPSRRRCATPRPFLSTSFFSTLTLKSKRVRYRLASVEMIITQLLLSYSHSWQLVLFDSHA